ncbi:bacillithiol biosynthesis cysteine-adding enzyme BshC [Microaerobacter geothermalis]|uniref:bacillithiol biosynthesis cysteine-adding enzyme BshC n=1 Tax=Microaerobacter geothermalis TaxID=674972 RepID=UPI001F171815|nr:bacillithiol biosynthesis cysteine-adding enzyme BshC [Microaerobacter geothermalis]MCF6093593.1 bacillithiol biosynthesis cysteine-adding enzyme BshC [Microaerobacter geothermalis]
MRMDEVFLSQITPLGAEYITNFEEIRRFYHYSPFLNEDWEKRADELLDNKKKHMMSLVDVLAVYNGQIGNHHAALVNIERLRTGKALVVLGGQQAGVLTGPLYTIYKAITILKVAKRAEDSLGVPVIPVFWIAGEDHDYSEVDHVYLQNQQQQIQKLRLSYEPDGKYSIGDLSIPKESLIDLIDQFFSLQHATEFTEEWQGFLKKEAIESDKLTRFFARLLVRFFGSYGLVLIDSSDCNLRKLESSFFEVLINKGASLNQSVLEQGKQVKKAGFHAQVDLREGNANLFIYENGERLLLSWNGDRAYTKDEMHWYKKDELLRIAKDEPEKLSTNVVFRPLMQEFLFPTLAFVAGPGEIAYWGLYKKMFEDLGMKIPILVPRISITLVEGMIQKSLDKLGLSFEDAFYRLSEKKELFMKQIAANDLEQAFEWAKNHMRQAYEPVLGKVKEIPGGLETLTEKNWQKIVEQVDFLKKRATDALKVQHESTLRHFDKIEGALTPLGLPQERVYNLFSYINKHGEDWLHQLMSMNMEANGTHKVVYL